jgi:hypothetical protein
MPLPATPVREASLVTEFTKQSIIGLGAPIIKDLKPVYQFCSAGASLAISDATQWRHAQVKPKSYFLRADADQQSHSKKGWGRLVRLLPATLIIICLAVAVVALRRGWFTKPGGGAALAPAADRVESELITLRPFGFEPAEIKRPAGEIVFIINNRSLLQDMSLTLSRVQGNRPTDKVKDVGLRKGQPNWFERFNLPPGDYVLTEAGHPEWKCAITLTPR